MPFAVPSLADKRVRARQNLAARIPGADVTLRRGVLPVIADVAADLSYDECEYLTWQVQQLFPDTASLPYLIRFAAIFGIVQKGASPAGGSLVFSGQAGSVIPAGCQVQTSDGTVLVQTSSQVLVLTANSTVTVPAVAITPGSAGNLDPQTSLTLIEAIAGVAPTATVGPGGFTGGADVESQASLLQRTLQRIQAPPQGGAATDYVQWAEEVPGVTRAWSLPRNRGTGTIDVTFVMDGRADIIPTATDVAAVQAQLDLLRPVVGDCVAFAPTPDAIVIALSGVVFSGAVTQADGEAAIVASLTALFAGATPGGAVVVGPGVSSLYPAGLVEVSQINIAIGGTTGVVRYELDSPIGDVQSAQGHLSILAGVTFS